MSLVTEVQNDKLLTAHAKREESCRNKPKKDQHTLWSAHKEKKRQRKEMANYECSIWFSGIHRQYAIDQAPRGVGNHGLRHLWQGRIS
jgi:hypothetical protein